MASLLDGLSFARFMEVTDGESATEGKYGIPRFDGSVHHLQEYSFRVRMRALKEKDLDPAEIKKIGPLGIRLVEGLRGPALHIVKQLDPETLASEKGPELIVKKLTETLRPRRQQEARELYQAGAKEHGPLSRQHGEPMAMFTLRRRTWWSMLQDLDSDIRLPEIILAEQILQSSKISDDQALMVRTVLGNKLTVSGVCDELLNHHGAIHLKERRQATSTSWRPRFGGGKHSSKGKGKPWQSYAAYHEETFEGADEAYFGCDYDQTYSEYRPDDGNDAGYYAGYEAEVDYDLYEGEDPILNVFAAMVAEGLDENIDQESAEYAAEVLQAESEAYFTRQQAQSRGHSGFGGKYEVRGELSLEERKARVTALKARTACRRCGQKGHWSGDPTCPKGSSKGKRPAVSSASSSLTSTGKGGKTNAKPGKGSFKPRTVYFAVTDQDPPKVKTGYMAYNGKYSQVPPPKSLASTSALGTAGPPSSLDGVAPTSLTSMLSWTGPKAKPKAKPANASPPSRATPSTATTTSSAASSSSLTPTTATF